MFTTFLSVLLAIALIPSVFAQSGFMIDTPDFVQCQPTQITWIPSGYPPYDLLIVSANDVCGESLEDLGNQTGTDIIWTADFAAGTPLVLSLMDAAGNEAWSGTITVDSSNDTSCLASNTSSAVPSDVPGTTLFIPSSGGAATTTSSSPTASPFSPAGAAGNGLLPASSAALSMHSLSAITLFSSTVIAFVALTF